MEKNEDDVVGMKSNRGEKETNNNALITTDDGDVEIFLNEDDGFPNDADVQQELLEQNVMATEHEQEDEGEEEEEEENDKEPKSIIVTGVHEKIFLNPQLKSAVEELFRQFGESAKFYWLRSFLRLRVIYDSHEAAANAREYMHGFQMLDDSSSVKCYFAQTITQKSEKNLRPPAPYKQFLISPPSSPPAGWVPRAEGEPLVNHDLLAALANLTPGAAHELHPPADGKPAIVVHLAAHLSDKESREFAADKKEQQQQPILQTRCPERV